MGWTTFSTYSTETLALLESGAWRTAAWYILGSNGLSLTATFAGMALG